MGRVHAECDNITNERFKVQLYIAVHLMFWFCKYERLLSNDCSNLVISTTITIALIVKSNMSLRQQY